MRSIAPARAIDVATLRQAALGDGQSDRLVVAIASGKRECEVRSPGRHDGRAGAVGLTELADLVARREAVRALSVVGVAGQLHGPVRCDEAEAVPASSPRLPDAAPLEHDMLDAGLRQLMADGQPGLTGADDDDASTLRATSAELMSGSPLLCLRI